MKLTWLFSKYSLPGALVIFGLSEESEMSNMTDGGQSLAPEPVGVDILQVAKLTKFAGGEAFANNI